MEFNQGGGTVPVINTQISQERPGNWKKTTYSRGSVSFLVLRDRIHLSDLSSPSIQSNPSIQSIQSTSIHPIQFIQSIHPSVHPPTVACYVSEVNRSKRHSSHSQEICDLIELEKQQDCFNMVLYIF